MLAEFKKFILKGNMVDLAVGVIIGASFGKVVEKFSEMLMSGVGAILAVGGIEKEKALNFDSVAWGGVKVGSFVTALINLMIVGFALFLFVKMYNQWIMKPQPAPAQPPQTPTEKLLTEIRDLLQKQAPGDEPGAQALPPK